MRVESALLRASIPESASLTIKRHVRTETEEMHHPYAEGAQRQTFVRRLQEQIHRITLYCGLPPSLSPPVLLLNYLI